MYGSSSHIAAYPVACRVRLASPLHKACSIRRLYGLYGPPSHRYNFTFEGSVLNQLVRIVEKFDPRVLASTLRPGSTGLAPGQDRCWQVEVYRACGALLPGGATILPDVGLVSDVAMIMALMRAGCRFGERSKAVICFGWFSRKRSVNSKLQHLPAQHQQQVSVC